jgi:alpha-ketoglutarate-dependent taurine dioxygenase
MLKKLINRFFFLKLPTSKHIYLMENSTIEKMVKLPAIVQLDEMNSEAFISYYKKNVNEIENELLLTGAVKFVGIQIDSLEKFQHIVNSISSKFLSYIDGNSPRIKLSENVYTSTEYSKDHKITMHNELSYSSKWPNKLFFSCLQPAQTRGETLLADSREILKKMNKTIVSEIRKRGITYIRNLHGGKGIGPSWQDTFETTDKRKLEACCHSLSIDFEWRGDFVRLKQSSKGIIEHRNSKQEVWFNQIDQFHPCHLGEETFETMKMLFESPEHFPMYVRFGDGTEISESFVREVLKTIDEVTIAPTWQKNELLILDNELVSHGRNPYTGERNVLVAMSE